MEYLELTQLELAKRAGLTQASISVYINGKVMPTAYTLAKLAKALIMSADDLIGHME
jgi:transcriptional regulator with XRE-family HTH domain